MAVICNGQAIPTTVLDGDSDDPKYAEWMRALTNTVVRRLALCVLFPWRFTGLELRWDWIVLWCGRSFTPHNGRSWTRCFSRCGSLGSTR